MGWTLKVGPRYQITIRKLAPILNIEPGDFVQVDESVWKGKLVISKKDEQVVVRKRREP